MSSLTPAWTVRYVRMAEVGSSFAVSFDEAHHEVVVLYFGDKPPSVQPMLDAVPSVFVTPVSA